MLKKKRKKNQIHLSSTRAVTPIKSTFWSFHLPSERDFFIYANLGNQQKRKHSNVNLTL